MPGPLVPASGLSDFFLIASEHKSANSLMGPCKADVVIIKLQLKYLRFCSL